MESQLSAQFKATFEAELSINLNPELVVTQLLETLKTEMEHEVGSGGVKVTDFENTFFVEFWLSLKNAHK